ncbi:hypothetical protein B0H17DRAFT_1212738 [Mycena rosella]|uniref:Uncharacterized protein n=1 Tax=Mycena rosella TaxID=1033263 RepID=A0AAD7CSH5_MYCRO|nr:hypothetical protein B0H17DRAFT_1212738 [Mycena rosella]
MSVKSLSAECTDTHYGEPSKLTLYTRQTGDTILKANSKSKVNELFAVVTNIKLYNQSCASEAVDFPATRGIQSTCIAEICERIDEYSIDEAETPTDLADEDVSSEEESGQPIDEGSEAALSSNFSALEAICVGVGKLRARPTPTNESHWVPILDQLITLAAQNFARAFSDFVRGGGKPQAQAMPRFFARQKSEIRYDPVGLPRTFQPDRGLYMTRQVSLHVHPGLRQRRCMTTAKKFSDSTVAVFPVLSAYYTARNSDLEQVKGQALYSAVAAAGVYQNAQSDAQPLTLAVAGGFVHAQGACWPGKLKSTRKEADVTHAQGGDICIVDGKPIDLG